MERHFNEKTKGGSWGVQNTFQAEKPLTVEKRLYFNADGELIKELQSTYKMNSKEKSTASFADREVAYNLQLNKMEFYDFWKGN